MSETCAVHHIVQLFELNYFFEYSHLVSWKSLTIFLRTVHHTFLFILIGQIIVVKPNHYHFDLQGAVNFALMMSQMEGGCPVDYNTITDLFLQVVIYCN